MVGLLNINKPVGMTSRRVVDIVARLAGTKRVGHAGTLDPLASGVLVVCLGWATRLVPYIQERPKTYRAGFLLGRRSDTDDVTGTVVEIAGAVRPPRDQIESALSDFVGEIQQVPPQFSAVHVQGKRAHKLARRGESVTIEPRTVCVYRIELLAYDFPALELLVECGSGTYIRAIGRDLGNALGCGAVMDSLVRERIGEFSIDAAVGPDALAQESLADFLMPPLAAVSHFPRHLCTTAESAEILRGRPVTCPPSLCVPAGQLAALLSPGGDLAALARIDADQQLLRPHQVFAGTA